MTIIKENNKTNLYILENYFRYKKNGKYWVSVSDKKPTRSTRQNKYYWSMVVAILSRELGYTSEEMHDVLRYKFLGVSELEFSNEKIIRLNSTTKLNTVDMEDYLSNIRMWASSELSIMIPLPNEVI